MPEKDNYQVQRARIDRIVKEICPTCVVEYDQDRVPTWIRFRIVDGSGTVLAATSGDWHVSEIADKSDDWLRQFIKQSSAGRI